MFFLAVSLSAFPSFWWPGQLCVLVRHFVEHPLSEFVWSFSLDWTGVTGFREENLRSKVPFSSHHLKGTYYQHEVSLLMLTFITWLRERPSSSSTTCYSFCLSILCSSGRSNFVQPTLRSRELCSSMGSSYINYLELFCPGDLSSLPNLLKFNHLFILVWTHGYLFYTLGYNLILVYLFCCSDYPSVGRWELFHLAPLSFAAVLSLWGVLGFYFLALQDAPRSFCVFPVPVLDSAISSFLWSPGSFYWRTVLGIRNQDQSIYFNFWMWSYQPLIFSLEGIFLLLIDFQSTGGNTLIWYIKITFLDFWE